MTLFEFGSGNSTIWFSERIGDIVSVEITGLGRIENKIEQES